MISFLKLADVFNRYNLEEGRMISHSKSTYKEEHPFNTIHFNANIFINKAGVFFKIWHGDLDVSLEGDILKRISKETDTTLYIVPEMEGRYKNENRQDVPSVSVWDTTMETPFVDKETHDALMKKRAEARKTAEEAKIEKYRKERELSERLPKIDVCNIMGSKIIRKISVTKEEIDIHLKRLSAMTKTKQDSNQDEFFPETIFANDFLDYKIQRELKLKDMKGINYSGMWIGEEFNRTLNRYNREFDKKFMKEEEVEASYKPEDMFEYSSYMSTYRYRNTNELGYSNASLEDFVIYILENWLKP